MGPLPPAVATPPVIEVLSEEASDGFLLRKIMFEPEKDDRVPAYLLIPNVPARHRQAVLCLHQTTRVGKAEPAGLAGLPNLHYASELARRGFVALAPDYPNFGDYKIDVYARGYVSATMKGIVNHRRAIDILCAMPAVDRRRVSVIGHSLGGHNSLFIAAFDTRISSVVTSCGFTSFAKYYGGDLTGWSHPGYMPRIASAYNKSPAKMPFDFPDVLRAIAPRRLFINAPLHDSNFDVAGVRECVSQVASDFPAGCLMVEHPDCTHDFPTETRRRAYNWLERR